VTVSTDFPGRPRLEKGALLVYDSQEPNARPSYRVVFQYNPEQVRRTFTARSPQAPPSNAGAAREDVLRVPGPPVETITMTVVLDAADQVGQANSPGLDDGLHPTLAALELLLYPSTALVNQLDQHAAQGEVQVQPADVPLVMLSWGRSRTVPVMLSTFSITEEQFDPLLNPIQAKVELGMKVLTYMEFKSSSAGRDAFISYQRQKEQLATRGRS
jgi:hypothetical protein